MRNCECVGIPSMFQGRVDGVGGSLRVDDGTETRFDVRGKSFRTDTFEHPTYGTQTITYSLMVTVKDYVPGSGKVKYTTWGRSLYPGFNPTPNWKTVSEDEFVAMYPEWVSARENLKPTVVRSTTPNEGTFYNPPKGRSQIPISSTYVDDPPSASTSVSSSSALPLLLGVAYLLLS